MIVLIAFSWISLKISDVEIEIFTNEGHKPQMLFELHIIIYLNNF